MVSRNPDKDYKNLQDKRQLDVFGTPMPVQTPINFAARLEMQKEGNKAAMKKLMVVSFVSVFFITA